MSAAPDRLQSLLEVSQLLSSKLELSELLPTVLNLASKVVDAESASLLLFDKKTQTLYFDVALGLGPEANRLRLPLGQGIAGAVAQSKEALLIPDAPKDPRWSPQMDKMSGFATRSILAVPMTLQGRLIGVLEAINKKQGTFQEDDKETLEAFAVQAAIAIEHARLFASLAEERFRLECIFASMADGAVLSDEVGQVLVANDAARKLLGIDGDSSYITDAWKNFTLTPPIEEILRRKTPARAFEAAREAPTKLVLSGLATPTKIDQFNAGASKKGEAKPGLLCVFRDVTEEKRREKLKRSFLDLISHKLKTPLVSILGYSEILLETYADEPQDAMPMKAVRPLAGQSHKLSELIDKLLKYTALEDPGEAGAFRPCKAEDLVREAVEELKPLLAAQKAVVESGPSSYLVSGDRLKLKDVLKNLVENAVKFNPKSPKAVSIAITAGGGHVNFTVTDKGPGIPPEVLEKLFSGFEQVENDFTGQIEGWGLGLPFVKKVVEQHHGRVDVSSRLGEGTTVSVSLPAA